MPDVHSTVARYRNYLISYQEENPFSMHGLTALEWEQALEQAAEDALEAGATDEEIQKIRNDYS